MKRFENILVAVDLSQGDRFVSADLAPPTTEAIEHAMWLAKLNSARLTFFSALEVSSAARLEMQEATAKVLTESDAILSELVDRALADQIDATKQVQYGKSWMEIIRHTIRKEIDLVVAGTRHVGARRRGFLIGSTGIKLLRKCPCPVWITQPRLQQGIRSVLVAHCLREVGDTAMELGASMAQLKDAELHVLHVLEFPEHDEPFPARISAETVAQYRNRAEHHIQSQLSRYQLAHAPQVHIVTDPPDFAILDHIEERSVDLVVMGTIARTGIAGFITGNTAERLLPQIPCSVLAVKPRGFVSPLST